MTHTICQNHPITDQDGLAWKVTLMATPGVGTWNVKATLTRPGRTKEKHGCWSSRTGWTKNMWHPLPGSAIAQIAEGWMKTHSVPISGGVVVRQGRP